ncbi:diacylglycerol kinase [Streptomyces pathocidini]|uniref:diacylglycerol kinase n=1 Tax=Streptomyces pathocidini TaxID=1650571 RepID=UPI0033DA5377
MVIDPAARRVDGEAVRIARDVLCAGATAKICLPEGPEELARALSRRGGRRPVVVGDDAALRRTVGLLHRERVLGEAVLALVPVGATPESLALARALGVPTGPVAAARAVLDGVDRPLDLLVDDSDGVVLSDLRIPAGAGSSDGYVPSGREPWWAPGLRTCRSLVRGTGSARPVSRGASGNSGAVPSGPHRLRVEADGVLLADLDDPVEDVSVTTAGTRAGTVNGSGAVRAWAEGGGMADVVVRPSRDGGGEAAPRTARARAITVSGADFHYRADTLLGGPVRTRTWTVHPAAWRLTVPRE